MNPCQKTTAADMKRFVGILPYQSPEAVPISFIYCGKKYNGFSEEMKPRVEKRKIDSNIQCITITGHAADLAVEVEYTEYHDFPVCEWKVSFTNTGAKRSGVLSAVRIGEGRLTGENASLLYSNGDTGSPEGYEYFTDDLAERFHLFPNGTGTPCCGASPYMRLRFADGGVNIAVGWSGTWDATFEKSSDSVGVSFGQKRCNMYLEPGETMRSPLVLFMAYAGDEAHGRNLWRRYYFKHIMPKDPDGNILPPKMCEHVFMADGHPEFTGATEENQVGGIRDYVARGLKPDVWWFDAGWYPCDYDWDHIGTWEADPERFPTGLGVVGDECHKNGIQFLLWFEPERVRPGTWLYENHPEWILNRGEDINHMVNLGNPDCLNWVIDHVDGLIKQYHVDIYRQDFNFNPMPTWEVNESPDRQGAIENLHVQGYYKYWDALLERNPGLWIDSCASGGRRNDLETMRRAIPLQYTDVHLGVHTTKEKQHRFMFELIPYFRAHNMAWDDDEGNAEGGNKPHDEFSFQVAMAPAITCMVEHDGPEWEFDVAKKMVPIWRRAAALMTSCDYYPLTECRKSTKDYYAMEFYSPEEKHGFFQVVGNTQVEGSEFTFRLTLDEDCEYKVENAGTGEVSVVSGKTLSAGYSVPCTKRSGTVFFFEAVQK